ncbi:MAG: EamA family transporter [bacterium]|nr:EamA family transporter [bacterium]
MNQASRTAESNRQPRWLGPLLVLGSAFVFSLSGVLAKAIDAGSWTIATWRGIIGAAGIAGYVHLRNRHQPVVETFRLGWQGWTLATVGAVASLAFIVAFKRTFVANVSVIYATIPFAAAVLERVTLAEPIRARTMTAAGASVAGVIIIMSGSLGTPNLDGDAVAIAMVLLNALYMVLIRALTGTDVVLAGGASALLLFVAGWFFTDPLDVSTGDSILLVLFGVAFAAAVVLWTEGTKLIPAAESGLLGSAETPLAIAMAWIILTETPPATSLIGAAIVLAAVLVHTRLDLTATKQTDTGTEEI